MSGGVQPALLLRDVPHAVNLDRQAEAPQFEPLEPVVQAAEVDLLLLVMRLARAVHVEAAGRGRDARQLVEVEEAEAEDELVLRRVNVARQHGVVLALLEEVAHPDAGVLAGDGVLVDNDVRVHRPHPGSSC